MWNGWPTMSWGVGDSVACRAHCRVALPLGMPPTCPTHSLRMAANTVRADACYASYRPHRGSQPLSSPALHLHWIKWISVKTSKLCFQHQTHVLGSLVVVLRIPTREKHCVALIFSKRLHFVLLCFIWYKPQSVGPLCSQNLSLSDLTTDSTSKVLRFEPRQGQGIFLFPQSPNPNLKPILPPVIVCRWLFTRAERPEREAHHLPLPSAEIKNEWIVTSTLPWAFIACTETYLLLVV